MRVLRTSRRALLGLTTTVALTTGLVTAPAATAATDPHPRAVAATTWLSGELDRRLPFEQTGFASWGPTLDAYFAFDALDVRAAKRRAILDTLEGQVGSYVGTDGESYAGPLGKLLTALTAQGIAPSAYSDTNVLTRLEARIDDSGADAGRAYDQSTWGDFSNSVGQSFVVRALAQLDHPRAGDTVAFLLKQQCAEGYFREDMDSPDYTCDAGTPAQSAPDVDSTAYAVLALVVARDEGAVPSSEVGPAIRSGARWLVDVQRANGAFRGADEVSANSTGLAAMALSATGREARAAAAARWLRDHQVTAGLVRRTELRRRYVGAIAPSHRALQEAESEGIEGAERISWQLATGQAAAGLTALR